MPKLYYFAHSCGVACFIAFHAAGVTFQTEQVEIGFITNADGSQTKAHVLTGGGDYYAVNPKGNVPCLVLDDGTILNENSAILDFVIDQAVKKVGPAHGTTDRLILRNVLSYASSEIHQSIGNMFRPHHEEVLKWLRTNALKKMEYLDKHMIGTKQFVVGDSFTVADAYLFVLLGWTAKVNIDLTPYPNVKAYLERIGSLPVVVSALERMSSNPTTAV